jgi:hypothetical protein
VIIGGNLVEPLPGAAAARAYAAESLAKLPPKYRSLETVDPYPVEQSEELQLLVEQTRNSHAASLPSR